MYYNDYVVPNPGGGSVDNSQLFVLPNYVLDGYINIESSSGTEPYVVEGYVDADYVLVSVYIWRFHCVRW